MDQARRRVAVTRVISPETQGDIPEGDSIQKAVSEVAIPLATDVGVKYRRGRSLKEVHQDRLDALAAEERALIRPPEPKRTQLCMCGCGELTRKPWTMYIKGHDSIHKSKIFAQVSAGVYEAIDDLARYRLRDRASPGLYAAFFAAFYERVNRQRGFWDPDLHVECTVIVEEILQVENPIDRWTIARRHARNVIMTHTNDVPPPLTEVEHQWANWIPRTRQGKKLFALKMARAEGGIKGNIPQNE